MSSDHSSSFAQPNATLKIKGCCDRCALSKVKCDRQRPVCGRCVTIGRDLGIAPPCNYSVSLRTLKKTCGPAKNARRTSYSQKQQSSNARTPAGGELESPCRDTTDSNQPQQGYFSNIHPGSSSDFDDQFVKRPDPAPMYDPNTFWDGFGNDMMLMDGFEDSSSSTSTPILNDQFVNAYLSYGVTRPIAGPYYNDQSIRSPTATSSSNSSDSLFYGATASTSGRSSSTSSSSSSLFQGTNPMDLLGMDTNNLFLSSDSRGCCAARICNTIQALWKVSKRNACTPSSSSQQPQVTTLDQALLLCRNALESIASVWKCPCANQPGSEFSSAFIIHAALSFFRSIIQGILATSHYGGDESSSSSSSLHGMMTFETPIQMGVYTMDAEDEQRFKLQLVRTELGKVSRMIDEFSKRFCEGGAGADYLGQAQPSDMLKRCLSMELEACKAILDSHAP